MHAKQTWYMPVTQIHTHFVEVHVYTRNATYTHTWTQTHTQFKAYTVTTLTVGDCKNTSYTTNVCKRLCTHHTDYWLFQHNCWPEAALPFPFLGPGFLSTSPARSSRRPRKRQVRIVTALVTATLRCATRLRRTGQGWWGVNWGGAGKTSFETLAHGGEEVKRASVSEHAVRWSSLTLMHFTKAFCTVNDTTKWPCVFLPHFTPLRSLGEGSFTSRPQSFLDSAWCLYLQNQMHEQFSKPSAHGTHNAKQIDK